jgi:hypothetical protein
MSEKSQPDEHPFVIDGVRHDAGCALLHSPAFHAQRLSCTCGASAREHASHWITPLGDRLAAADRSNSNRARAAERERIAGLIERLDNTMMDRAKLAAYVRGQETV